MHTQGLIHPPAFLSPRHNPQSLPSLPGLLSISSHSLQACQDSPNSSQRGLFPTPTAGRVTGLCSISAWKKQKHVPQSCYPSSRASRKGHGRSLLSLTSVRDVIYLPLQPEQLPGDLQVQALLPGLPLHLWGGSGTQSHLLTPPGPGDAHFSPLPRSLWGTVPIQRLTVT